MSDWLKWVLLGLLSIVLGGLALGNVALASMAIATMTGALFLVAGVFQLAAGFSVSGAGPKIFALLLGLVLTFLGWSFLANPLEGMISLTMLIAFLLALSGITRIVFSLQMRGTGLFGLMLLSGVVPLLFAIFIWMNFDMATMTLLGVLLGIELVFNGIGLLMIGFFVKRLKTRL